MTLEQAKQLLAPFEFEGQDEEDWEQPITLPASVLKHLGLADVPDGARIQVGYIDGNVHHLEWSGVIGKQSGQFVGFPDYTWTRKYWYNPLGLEQYLDLVRRAVEARNKVHGDVELSHYEDDGAYIHLSFSVQTKAKNLGDAYGQVCAICNQLEEAAEQASDEIGKRISEVAARLSGWGTQSFDELVNAVEKAKSTDERGRSLEELVSRLLETVPGFTVTGRIRTATEEIDITVLNDSVDARFRRESALILAECKNWSGKCGKDEFVIFKEKLEKQEQTLQSGHPRLLEWIHVHGHEGDAPRKQGGVSDRSHHREGVPGGCS
jgi:hypothetical protein